LEGSSGYTGGVSEKARDLLKIAKGPISLGDNGHAKLSGVPSFVFVARNPFDGGELADDTANSPQAVRISATFVVLDLDQCAIEIMPRILLSCFVGEAQGLLMLSIRVSVMTVSE
jgi:hypothetical protein